MLPRGSKAKIKIARRSKKQAERIQAVRSDEESAKNLPKSSEVTIQRPCRTIMSSEGARGSPERPARELLRSFRGGEVELGEAQKSSAEACESLEDDLKIKNLDVRENIEK